jgi:hypothetical protein
MKAVLAVLLAVFMAQAKVEDSSKPTIAPFFDRIDDGPAFFVVCRNTTDQEISSEVSVWMRSLRLDGTIVSDNSNEFGPGLNTQVAPGESWRGIIALRQSTQSFFPAVKFGALKRYTRVLPLSQGRHTIAIQCAGVWSADFEFYWESGTHP